MFPHSNSRSGASAAQMRDCRECPPRKKERKHPFLQQMPESVCLASRDSAAMLITAMTPLFLEGGTACCRTVGEKQYQQGGEATWVVGWVNQTATTVSDVPVRERQLLLLITTTMVVVVALK